MPTPFVVGAVDCVLLEDGRGGLLAEVLFANAPREAREAALGGRLSPDGRVLAPFNCLLVHAAGHVMLVDTGLGPYEHPLGGTGGRLEHELRDAGVHPDDVDVVVLTHGHLDHIGGLSRDGRPVFARARHLISRDAWTASTDESRLKQMPPRVATAVREQLAPLARAGVLEIVDGERELAERIRLVPAPGHSPGHLAVDLAGGALYLADLVVDELHVVHPEWAMAIEADPALVLETRRRLLGRAADEALTVAAAHLARPARVERAGESFRLVSLASGRQGARV